MESSGLLANLAIALAAAAVGAVLAVRLRQSTIVGYLVAGVALGRFTPGFVADPEIVGSLADIGVIFLMFGIGAQLSISELQRSGPLVLVGGTVQIVLVIAAGVAVGIALGWSELEALFFGAVASMSSSAILAKVLGERGEIESQHGTVSLGWAAVQDFAVIGLVVLLIALAGSGTAPAAVGLALVKAGVFLVLVVPVGMRIVPRTFEWLASFRSREVFIFGVVTLAIGTAYLGTFFGISLALGAFLAGIVVSESDLSHQIVGETVPLRDLFAGLFFVSIGMLVDPAFVASNWPLVLAALVLIVPFKALVIAALTLLFRYPVRTAVLTGLGLAQSAEFSFLLARLGSEMGAVGQTVFGVMLTGAVGSIVLAPALQAAGSPLAGLLERRFGRMAPNPLPDVAASGRRVALVCGYGRVGRLVVAALERRGFTSVVIEQDPHRVAEARAKGIRAVRGSADNPVVRAQLRADPIAVVVVAVPDPVVVRRIVAEEHQASPRLPIVARTHSPAERAVLRRLGATAVVVGELELGLQMTRFALREFGVSTSEADLLIAGLRASG